MTVREGLTPEPGCSVDQGKGDPGPFLAMLRRMIAAAGRRVGEYDASHLADLMALHRSLDDATQRAVDDLRSTGYSWSQIGAGAGMTKQAAHERWGR